MAELGDCQQRAQIEGAVRGVVDLDAGFGVPLLVLVRREPEQVGEKVPLDARAGPDPDDGRRRLPGVGQRGRTLLPGGDDAVPDGDRAEHAVPGRLAQQMTGPRLLFDVRAQPFVPPRLLARLFLRVEERVQVVGGGAPRTVPAVAEQGTLARGEGVDDRLEYQ